MGMHDKLAEKAAALGHTAADFSATAQRHANATWGLLIAAGALWYFVDWKWALIPAALGAFTALRSASATAITLRLETMETTPASTNNDLTSIVQAYAKALETDAPIPGMVADARKLPYPKQQIKQALVAALRIEPDQQMREQLKAAYVCLADWQDAVGATNQGFDLTSLDQNQNSETLAKQVYTEMKTGRAWFDTVQREHEALKKELEKLGLW